MRPLICLLLCAAPALSQQAGHLIQAREEDLGTESVKIDATVTVDWLPGWSATPSGAPGTPTPTPMPTPTPTPAPAVSPFGGQDDYPPPYGGETPPGSPSAQATSPCTSVTTVTTTLTTTLTSEETPGCLSSECSASATAYDEPSWTTAATPPATTSPEETPTVVISAAAAATAPRLGMGPCLLVGVLAVLLG